jgi:predicted P-loop ATPase
MPVQKILNALVEISERNKYNPIKNYLQGLSWDGEPRLNKWLVNTGKTDDNSYIEAIGSKYLMGAVARIYEPGIKFDNVLVLEGPENMGKSTVFRVLSEPWFCDSIDLMQSDEKIIEKMRGYWILEVAELFGMRDDNQERIKSFLTRQEDVQRLPYDRLTGTFKRQSVFCGSSNKMSCLFGEEGNRRFWPVKFESINIQWLRDNKDQLFAEAVSRYKDGEKLYLDPELYEYAKRVQSQKLSVNEVWLDIIDRFLTGKDETTMQEVLETCLKVDVRDLHNRAYAINAGRILKRLGFEKKDLSLKSGKRYVYVRENELAHREKQRLFIEEE